MMKKKLFLVTCLVALSTLLSAQKAIEVLERNATMSLGARTGYAVAFEGKTKKELKSNFEAFIQQYGKKISLKEISKTEYMLDDIVVNTISEKPIDIYIVFEEAKQGTTMTGFFDMGDGFISSTNQPIKYKDAENFMRRFAWRMEKIQVQAKLDDANKQMEKRKTEQKDLEKKNESLNKQISDCKATIDKAQTELKNNEGLQQSKQTEISSQQKTIDDIQSELKQYDQY